MTVTTKTSLASDTNGAVYRSDTSLGAAGWTKVGGLPTTTNWVVYYGGDKFIAVGHDVVGLIYYSYDGLQWTRAITPGSTLFNYMTQKFDSVIRVNHTGGYFWVGYRGGFAVSKDGISWNAIQFGSMGDSSNVNSYCIDVAYKPETGMYVWLTTAGDVYYTYNSDPTAFGPDDWMHKANAITSSTPLSMDYGLSNGQNWFIANASDNSLWRSTDGLIWNKFLNTQTDSTANIRHYNTDDPTNPSIWLLATFRGRVWYDANPVVAGTGFTKYKDFGATTVQFKHISYDGTQFSFVGARVSGATTPAASTLAKSLGSTTAFVNPNLAGIPTTDNNQILSEAHAYPTTAPTNITPAQGAAVNTPGPTLGMTLPQLAGSDQMSPQWQIDTVSTFDSPNLKTVNPQYLNGGPGAASMVMPNDQAFTSNGTWYIRGRGIGTGGNVTPWSGSTSFTVTIPAVPTPTNIVISNTADYWPVFGATLGAYSGGGMSRLEFQMAYDPAFTNIYTSFLHPASFYRTSGSALTSYSNPDKTIIFGNGTYYVRARAVSQFGPVSAWSAGVTFASTVNPPVLSGGGIIGPTGRIATSHPTVVWKTTALDNMSNYPRAVHMRIQTASDAGFTTNVTSTDDDGKTEAQASSGSVYIQSRVTPGTVYVRGVLVDDFGVTSTGYLPTVSFTISHPPATLPIAPANGVLVNYDTDGNEFSWKFNDTSVGDQQTAYQLILTSVATGTLAYDTGKVNSSASAMSTVIATSLKGVSLHWQVRTWDNDGTVGPYSTSRTVTFVDPAVITINSPTQNATVLTGRPTLSWTLGGTAAQKSFALTVMDSASLKTVYSRTGTTQTTVIPPQNVLTNTHSYVFTVNIVTTLGSKAKASTSWTASYQPPDPPDYTVDPGFYDQFGYIDINWASAIADQFNFTWTVSRRIVGADDWETLFVTTNTDVRDYHDWTAITGIAYEYMVSQDADRSGVLLGSSFEDPEPYVRADSGNWWFIDPADESNNFYVNVTDDSFSDEWEENEYFVVGRGRVKDVGTHLGLTGSVTAQIRGAYGLTARQRFDALRDMRGQNKLIVMRDPFGNFYNMTIGIVQYSHVAGTGTNEQYNVTIPVSEVII